MTSCPCRELLGDIPGIPNLIPDWKSRLESALAAPCPELAESNHLKDTWHKVADKYLAELAAAQAENIELVRSLNEGSAAMLEAGEMLHQMRAELAARDAVIAEARELLGDVHPHSGTAGARCPSLFARVDWPLDRDAWIAKTQPAPTPAPSEPAPYPWGDVDLTGGRVTVGPGLQMGTVTTMETDRDGTRCAWVAYDYPKGEQRMEALDTLRPAPFTPAVGQRVRVVSDANSHTEIGGCVAGACNKSRAHVGQDATIVTIASAVEVRFGDGEEWWYHPADLMLLADAPEAKPCPKPRWHKYSEAEQREMPVGTRLKLKGGPVVTKVDQNDNPWHQVFGGNSRWWDEVMVAQLKARVIGGAK